MEEEVKREKRRPEEVTCPEWMMTMGDAMSLLLCFFVLMLTFSTMEESKLMDVLGVLQGANAAVDVPDFDDPAFFREEKESKEKETLGGVGSPVARKVPADKLSPVILHSAEIVNRYEKLRRELTVVGFQNLVDLDMLNEGIAVRINVDQLFKENAAEMVDYAYDTLRGFAGLVGYVGNEIRITVNFALASEGTRNRFSSEWGTAIQRSIAVGDFLVDKFNVDRSRLSYSNEVITGDQQDYVELMLMEKIGVSEVSIKDLLSMDL